MYYLHTIDKRLTTDAPRSSKKNNEVVGILGHSYLIMIREMYAFYMYK